MRLSMVGRIAPKPSLRPHFQRRYTPADVKLPASVDHAHDRLSGPATRVAATMSDSEAARRMQQAGNAMIEQIKKSA